MFRSQRMDYVRVFVPIDARERVMHELHEDGLCQIDVLKDTEHSQFLRHITRVISRLERYQPKKVQPSQGVVRTANWFAKMQKDVDSINETTVSHIKSIKEVQHDLRLAKKTITTLRLLPNLPTNFYEDSNLLQVEVGVVPADQKLKLDCMYAVKQISKDEHLVVAVGLESDNIHKQLFTFGFKRLAVDSSKKTPKQLIKTLEKNIAMYEKRIATAREMLGKLAREHLPKLHLYKEELDIFIQEQQGLNTHEVHESFASFTAWVPHSKRDAFEVVLARHAKDYIIESSDKSESDEAPTLLDNRNVVKPFEIITKLYSVPKNRGFDPTFFIAISFPLFFGLMLTDFVYGLALLIFAAVLFKKAPAHEEGLKGFSALLIICALVTMVMGLLFGSYFGNFFQMLGVNVPLLLDSMKDIIPMIAIVLTLGMLHITLGLIIGFIEYLKNGQIRRALSEQGVWLVFVLSVVVLLLPFDQTRLVGIGLLALSVFMQFFFTARRDGAINAVLSLFDYSGFLGDVFSYIRLMALAIGTSGIALAVNFMAFLANDLIPYVGIVFAIIVFIIGHLFNLVMNGLGAFIHTLRLHFLEHFSKYYDGGGKEYKPYYANRKFTEVKRNG